MPSPFSFFKKNSGKDVASPPGQEHLASVKRPKGKLRKASTGHAPPVLHAQPMKAHHIVLDDIDSNTLQEQPPKHIPRALQDIPLHSSNIPNGSVEGWRTFPPAYRVEKAMVQNKEVRDSVMPRDSVTPRDSAMPSETPDVSHYHSGGYLQPPHPEPMPPSRSWSPIPTVHRESFPNPAGLHHDSRNIGDEWGDDSITPISPQQRVPFKQIANSRYSTVASVGQQPSEHGLRYIEYPVTPIPNHQHLAQPREVHQDENVARSEPVRELVKPAIREHVDDESDSEAEIYHYIVPVGLDVIFQDEDGNEITRVGRTSSSPDRGRPLKSKPIIVHDELGKELYRDPSPPARLRNNRKRLEVPTEGQDGRGIQRRPWESTPPGSNSSSRSTKTIMVDDKGNQIPVKTTSIPRHGTRGAIHSPAPDISHHVQVDNSWATHQG